jgi:sigma-B regulation protein RsbU (phosphoserine phosphatase)
MIRSRLRMERLRHETLTRELSQARQIQLAWLPDPHPLGDRIDIAAVNSPASHISGDFYNWFELPDGRMVVTVGDVTGHGMSAAFLMATTQLLVRNTMVRLADPGRCLEEVNRQLCVQVFNGQFVTMVVMILDVQRGSLQVAIAGHPAPLIADGESFQPIPLEPQLVLGVDRETKYVTETYDLSPQTSLLLYTDGVVECPDSKLARFGDERLRRTLYGRYDTAQEMLTRVITAVDEFRGNRVLDDDLTMVAIQLQSVPLGSTSVAEIAV